MSFEVEKDWVTRAGLRAVVIMNDSSGSRCGYVGIEKSHPLFGVSYHEETRVLKTNLHDLDSPASFFEVHGGLTYSGSGGEYPVPSELHWFGYDCEHAGDIPKPGSAMWRLYRDYEGVHRTLDYCIDECESLAQQLVKVRP